MNVILGRSLTKRSETSWSRWKGFTLIELLTVIAIIGILASILIPVTARVRESTRRAVCGSNIRQQLMGMLMYAQDNDDSGYWEMVAASADNAPEGLYPNFVDDVDLFLCPSTKNVIDKQRVAAGITTQLRRPAPGGREKTPAAGTATSILAILQRERWPESVRRPTEFLKNTGHLRFSWSITLLLLKIVRNPE